MKWNVWRYDVWGNAESGWEVNDRWKIFSFDCESDDAKEIEKAFLEELLIHGYDISEIEFEFEWNDDKSFEVNNAENGKYLFGVDCF